MPIHYAARTVNGAVWRSENMNRRNFSKSLLCAAAGAVTLAARPLAAAESAPKKVFNCKFAANVYKWTNLCPNMTKGMSDCDKIKFWYDQGFRAIEDNDMMKYPPEKQAEMVKTMEKLGMQMGVFTCGIGSGFWLTSNRDGPKSRPNKEAAIERIKNAAKTTVENAKRVNAKWVTVIVGTEDRSLEHTYQMANAIEQLKYAAEICEKAGVVMVLETLSFTAHPGLWLQKTSDAYAICRSVGSPSCKILFDTFHQQNTEGSLIRNIDNAFSEIGYFHLGDVPNRTEPGTGEINFKNLISHIHNKGYRGLYGMEHRQSDPSPAGDEKLLKAYRDIDVPAV